MDPADAMPFSKLKGVTISATSPEAVEGTITVREDLCTAGRIMHGGAIMAFADALGAVGAAACLPDGAKGTTTIESKTNCLGAAPLGATVTARAVPLKTGRCMSVWQTSIATADGRPVAVVIQRQLVL